jgi:hypothetical protein
MAAIRGAGLLPTLGALRNNSDSLAAGQARILPAGELMVGIGLYSTVEFFDPVLNNWRILPRATDGWTYVDSDGVNWRIANRSGCAVGAIVTNHGSAYTSVPTITPTAGGSKWTAIIGGMLNTAPTITTAGAGYTYPPRLVVDAPPSPGIQATMTCTLSAGVVNAVTVVNQGGGYTSVPNVTVVPDPRDTLANITTPAVITAALTGAGTIAGVLCTDFGTPVTAVPTFTITGGGGTSLAITATMSFSATGYTVASGGTGYGAGTFITSSGGMVDTSVTAANVNPAIEKNIIIPRPVKLVPALSGAVIVASATTAPLTVEDWGYGFQLIPAAVPVPGTGLATAVATPTFTVGGQTDTIFVQPVRG